jgi:hypothetical protein
MRHKPIILYLAYASTVLSYAAWKGNAQATAETQYHNSKGERIYPVATPKIEEAALLGSPVYYTGADNQRYIDIHTGQIQHFNWTEFFKVATFGFGLLLLISFIISQVNKLNKEG